MNSIAIGLHLRADEIEPLAKAVPAADLFISAIDVADGQPLGNRDLLIRVATVRAQLLERATFVAVRYGFTFRSTAEAESKISAHAQRWREILEENRTRVELTLKVAAANERPDRRSFKSGADYMRALHAAPSISDRFKSEVEAHIGALCAAHRWTSRDATSVEFAGLIEREQLPRLAEAGESLKRSCPDVPFLLSAPWPLEVFADVDHE